MAKITIAVVKELHERTGLGMMECKKALTAAGGGIEKTTDDMRIVGAIKAAKKIGSIAVEGSTAAEIVVSDKAVVIIEVNSQTDFLALQDGFKDFVIRDLEKALSEKLTDAAPLVEAREEVRLALVAKTGEDINIRRLIRVEDDVVGAYLYNHHIGVVVNLKGGNPELAKDIAMHVAASNPQFLNAPEVSEEAITKEKEILLALNADKTAGKPEDIVGNMVKNRISKFPAEASLAEQPFVKNPKMKIGDLAKQVGAEIVLLIRYKVGGGIEKVEVDFAAEVAIQVAATKQ